MSVPVRLAAAFTRAWVWLYTMRLPTTFRDARRGEIDADLADHERDAMADGAAPALTAVEILLRTLRGLVDDVRWRVEVTQEHGLSTKARRAMWQLSSRQTRSLAACGLIGGLLWVSDLLLLRGAGAPSSIRGYVTTLISLLLVVGIAGVGAHSYRTLRWTARTGFVLMAAALLAFSLLNIAGKALAPSAGNLAVDVLGLMFAFLLPLGLLLFASGLSGLSRFFAVLAAVAFVAWMAVPRLVPAASSWGGRGDSPLGTTFFLVVAIALAAANYSVYRATRAITPR